MLISLVILGLLKIREQNITMAQYIASRMRTELSNSLFLTQDALRYSGEDKDAYELLQQHFGIQKSQTREILKSQHRRIIVSSPLILSQLPVPLRLITITLRGAFSSKYFRVFF